MPHSTFKSETFVLVVEDEPLLRLLAIDTVEEAGFVAIEACNADVAVKILEARDDISVLFTDIDMPGSMNGIGLAMLVRDRWPPVGIMITSGKHPKEVISLPARAVFFSKPYSTSRVGSALVDLAGAYRPNTRI